MHELALILVGLLAGSLLTEGLVLVPYWRGLTPERFYELHEPAGPRLFRYFAPLTIGAVGATMMAVAVDPGNTSMLAAALFLAAALLTFFIFFRKANRNLAQRAYDSGDLAVVLKTWAMWHHVRTAFVIAGFSVLVVW